MVVRLRLLCHSQPWPLPSLQAQASSCSPSAVGTILPPSHAMFLQPTLVLSPGMASNSHVSIPSSCLSVSGWCVCQGVVPIFWGALSLFCPHTGCCAVFWVAEAPPLSLLISPSVRQPPRVRIPFLFQGSPSGVQAPSWFLFMSSPSLFFLLFCLVMRRFSCPFWKCEVFWRHSVDVL